MANPANPPAPEALLLDPRADISRGQVMVGVSEGSNVMVNLPPLDTDAEGRSHIVFSPRQAWAFAESLRRTALEAIEQYHAQTGQTSSR